MKYLPKYIIHLKTHIPMLFKGLGVQKDTLTPCWLRPWQTGLYCIQGLCQDQSAKNLLLGQPNYSIYLFFLNFDYLGVIVDLSVNWLLCHIGYLNVVGIRI